MFSNRDLKKLIIPLLIEQFLAVTVGMLDVIMVSSVGEHAVSAVSLVDTISVLLIQVLSALATGGAVVASQRLGCQDYKGANMAANQLLLSTTAISVILMGIAEIWQAPLLKLIFGDVEKNIMDSALVYFRITAFSYPFLAIYNSCAALYRSMGNSKLSMKISFLMNGINLAGNALMIYGFHMGVAGVAYPTLVSRAVAAVVMVCLVRSPKNAIHIDEKFRLGFQPKVIKKIFHIGIPSGLEGGMFQLGKVIVASLITTYGSIAIAANAVGNTVAVFQAIPGTAINLAIITVVGQCVGAGDFEQAKKYTKKLLLIAHIGMFVWNTLMFAILPVILWLYNLSPDTSVLAQQIIIFHGTAAFLIWPASFILPNAMRAANDVRFALIVSLLSMWIVRVGFSYILGTYFGLGLFGVWIAMVFDWMVRDVLFFLRYRSGKWQNMV